MKQNIKPQKEVKYPSLYQVNTRVWLTELSKKLKKTATLDDIPEIELKNIADAGFDWVWFLSVWTTGLEAQKISRENPEWQPDFQNTLTDLKKEDIGGSGFAIAEYKVDSRLGGNLALKRLRERLKVYNLKLMLDFVPNHIGPDHSWASEHQDYLIRGTEDDLKYNPQNYTKIKENIFAYGRDPYFSGWKDTLQLDYSNPKLVKAMQQELFQISEQCDGVRCDMAMLILPEIFEKTWGRKALPFWSETIISIQKKQPNFCFMAEVYWNMEWNLQQLGFDYTYDKTLYDRLRTGDAQSVREHFYAELEYQDKLARFIENHDEDRAAFAFFSEKHKAAAVLTFLSPGMRFFHQGQFEGKTKRISPHLLRGPKEVVDKDLQKFYAKLLLVLKKTIVREGDWKLLQCLPAWDGNYTSNTIISFSWEYKSEHLLIVANYGVCQSQCYLKLPFIEHSDSQWILKDILNDITYKRDANGLSIHGLYLDMTPFQTHVFELIEDKNNVIEKKKQVKKSTVSNKTTEKTTVDKPKTSVKPRKKKE